MRNRDMQALMPMLQGLVALRDMLDGKELKAVVDELSKAEKGNREAAKAAQKATKEREAATKACEEQTAEMQALKAELDAQTAEMHATQVAIANAQVEFDQYRDAENERLNAWEQRLQSIPDTSDKLERKLARAQQKLERAETLEQQYTNRLIELGLQPAA